MKRKIGLLMMILGGLGLIIELSMMAQWFITDSAIAWIVCVFTLFTGIALMLWGISDYASEKSRKGTQ